MRLFRYNIAVNPSDKETAKQVAATYAVATRLRSGMRVGLGTGSTSAYVVREIAARMRCGELSLKAVLATSDETAALAKESGLPLGDCRDEVTQRLDVTIDGADEVDPALNLIKGGGGALVREKLVAANSRSEVIIIDSSKRVALLGERCPLPVAVTPCLWWTTAARIEQATGRRATLRRLGSEPAVTDDQLYLLDLEPAPIHDPLQLDAQIKSILGVVETGLFIGVASCVIIGRPDGSVLDLSGPAQE